MFQFINILQLILLVEWIAASEDPGPHRVPKQCGTTPTTASGLLAPSRLCAGDLIFHDDFQKLDFETWQHENTLAGGGNWEFQWYNNNRTNSFTKAGILHISPSLLSDQFGEAFLTSGTLDVNGGAPADSCTNPKWWGCIRSGNKENILNPIKSARLRTVNSFRFKYGKMEVRAKMPTGDWLWPADDAYGSWPSSGEIDLVECRGNGNLELNGIQIGVQQIGSTLHFGPYPRLNAWPTAHRTRNDDVGFDRIFRSYQMEWTPDHIKFSIDDKELLTVAPSASGFWDFGKFNITAPGVSNPWKYGTKMAPFDEEFYIIINLAVGGTSFFPDNANSEHGKPWKNTSPTASKDFWNGRRSWLPTWKLETLDSSLQVKYVKVWAL